MNAFRRIALLAAVLLPASGTAFGEPRVRDIWHAHIADGRRYGAEHTVVARLPDGNYRITRESRVLLDVLGVNKEEVIERREYVVTPDYHPVSIAGEGKRGSGTTRFAARRRGEALEVSATSAGVDRTRTFEKAVAILARPCLDDWLADRPADFMTGEVVILDDELCELNTAKVKRVSTREPGSAWLIDAEIEEGEQRIVLDADGLRSEFSTAAGMVELRRCSAEQARDLAYHKLDGRDLLMFPIDREIGTPDRLESLTVELRWKDIPFDRFHLEDDRQHLVEHSQEGGQHRAVVRIEPPRPIESPAHLPITGPEFAVALGESRYIKPRDPKIVAIAREVTRGKTDSLEAVKALADWVSKNVEATLNAETLTGPEVLACRKGKCSEFATLFASMARAAGIPTRIVLGDRLIPGQWAGHMWNEVYVGRWIPVDAGSNEVGRSFVLLKFLDHDSIQGVAHLRLALPASLDVRIIDHRATAAPLASRFKTGIEGRVYTNAELGCRMTAPAQGWSIEAKPQPGAVLLRFKVPGKDAVEIHFVAFDLPFSIAPKTLLAQRRKYYESHAKGIEFLSDEACTVSGLPGQQYMFRRVPEKGKAWRVNEVMWCKARSGYLLTMSVEESDYEDLKPSFTAILKSFEDLERK